jgi:DNA repair protein RadC
MALSVTMPGLMPGGGGSGDFAGLTATDQLELGTRGDDAHQRDLVAYVARIQQHLLERPNILVDHELLELILSAALEDRDTRPIARVLLAKYRTLSGTISASSSELTGAVGLKGTVALKLIQAATLNVLRTEVTTAPMLTCLDQVIDYLTVRLKHERVEHFLVLFLNNHGALIADEAQGRGSVNHVPVYPREVVRRCLELDATALIMVHNHPSGNPSPSREDIAMTKEVERAAATMGIALHDHIIIGRLGYRSFRQEKLL